MDSTGAISDSAMYPTGLTPCRFPRFSRPAIDTAAARRPIATARVAVEQADKLLALSTTDPDGLGAVLRTAWALLLRCYTGQDDVSFGFQRGGDDTGEPIVARFVLDDSASVAETVGRAKTELLAGNLSPPPAGLVRSGDHALFDTAVALWGFTETLAPCQVLAPVSHSPFIPPPPPPLTPPTPTLTLLIPAANTSSSTSSASW